MQEHRHENLEAQTNGISGNTSMVIDELVEKYEVESRFRKYSGAWAKAVTVIAVSMSLFHLYTAGFGSLMFIKQRAVHLAFLLVLAFLLYPATAKSPRRENQAHLTYVLWYLQPWLRCTMSSTLTL